jgi:hypothetical protein
MTDDENTFPPGLSRSPSTRESPDATSSHSSDVAPARASSNAASLHQNSAQPASAPLPFNNKFEIKDFFTPQPWHLPYAQALLSSSPTELPSLIAAAERSIFSRYLEICARDCRVHPVECSDLLHAIDALNHLKSSLSPDPSLH